MNLKSPTQNHALLRAVFSPAALRWLSSFVLAAGFLANAQSTDDSSTADFSSFQLIVRRNIFNPNRYGDSSYHAPAPETPTFSLAGTMSYRKGMFAFFDGTSSDYRKALQEGGTIAGYKVTKITFDGVQLQGPGKPIDMKVGAAMRRDGDSWRLNEPGEWNSSGGSETETESPAPGESPAAAPPSANESNDVLKRLMEKREQELK
jgi:hypothetical protein